MMHNGILFSSVNTSNRFLKRTTPLIFLVEVGLERSLISFLFYLCVLFFGGDYVQC